MNPRHYIDLKETSRELQPTYYFMINCLLYSRMETGLVSNQEFYDEDGQLLRTVQAGMTPPEKQEAA